MDDACRNKGLKQKTTNEKLKTLIAAVLLLGAVLVQTACGRAPGPVIIFCSPDSPRMRQAVAGLQARLGATPVKVVCVPEFGPEGRETLRQLRQREPRLLVTLGTPALIMAAPMVKKTPVVFGLVANPYFTGAAYDPAQPHIHQENITGIATPAPLSPALQHGASLLGPGPWGLLYDPTDGVAADLAQRFFKIAPRFEVQPLMETSTAAATDGPGLQRLIRQGSRVLYLPPTASAARYASLVLELGRQMKVRVVSSYPEGTHQGAALWVAVDYWRLGENIGDLARRVLAGEHPKSIPIVEKIPLKVETDEALLRKWSGYPPMR
ncbi:MAG: ABC transporter substrate-binding protein [Thermodesulfobacteriota bacterium]